MSAVFRTYYEVVGDGVAVAKAHFERVTARQSAAYKLAGEFGGVGFRPGHSGNIQHLIFHGDKPPVGFRHVQREPAGNIACVPHKGTVIGKRAAAALKAYEPAPTQEKLAAALGYSPSEAPMDGYKIYYPTAYRFILPVERFFLDLPRTATDGFEPGPMLQEVPASTFMLAMEAHNAAARALQATKPNPEAAAQSQRSASA